jgi:hypothetical protein
MMEHPELQIPILGAHCCTSLGRLQQAGCMLYIGCRLSVASFTMEVAGCRLKVAACGQLVTSCKLQVEECRSHVEDCWLLVACCRNCRS